MHSYIYNLQRTKENRNANEKMDENYMAEKDDILNDMNSEGASADYVEECKGNDLKAGEKVLKTYWEAKGLFTKESPDGNLLIERDQIKAYVDRQMERARKTINQLFEEKADIEYLLFNMNQLLDDKAGFWFMSDYGTPKTEYTFLSDLLKSGKKTFEMELLQVFDYHM